MNELREISRRQKEHFQTGGTLSLSSRRRALRTLVRMLRNEGDRIAGAIGEDLGRCWMEAWSSEPGLVMADASHALRSLFLWKPGRLHRPSPLMIPGIVRSRREPLGTAVIIGPWNYPAGLLLAPMVSALAAGNTVILKPSERAPRTAETLRSIIGEYFQPNLAAVVEGGGDTARWLIENAADVVCFTGSGDTGRRVMAAAAARPVPVILELGGVNPCFVKADANLKAAAERIAWGKFFAAGQTCLAPNHVFVEEEVFLEFLNLLRETVASFYGERPETSPDYGRIIDLEAWNRLEPMLSMGEPVCGGYGIREDLFIAPTVLSGVKKDSPLLREEIFGPVLPVIPCRSIEEEMASIPGGDSSPLAAYGFSKRPLKMGNMIRRYIRSGSVTVNGTLHRIVSSSIGFGGVGGSGFNRYRGSAGYRNFTWERVELVKCPGIEMPMVYPPYRIGRSLVRFLARFF